MPKKENSNVMPRGVPHPQAGEHLSYITARCQCGGITGICGITAAGAAKWRAHHGTEKHMKWDPTFPLELFEK
jgi:hypothetical protein